MTSPVGREKYVVDHLGKPSFLDCWRVHESYPRSEAAVFTSTHSTMLLYVLVLGALIFRAECYFIEEKFPEESEMQPPTVVIAIIARNAAHSLPYYLGALERLNYPKDRISVWWVSCMLWSSISLLYPFKRSKEFKWAWGRSSPVPPLTLSPSARGAFSSCCF